MGLSGLSIVVSIDGLQPEHDQRRAPATYERILKNIEGRKVTIHCTVTSQMARGSDSLRTFLEFWSHRPEVTGIRMSLYTPQIGEESREMLTPEDRTRVVSKLNQLGKLYPKLRLSDDMVKAYLNPPDSPADCIFARVTECISSDLKTLVVPCQLGGEPDCSQCGCVAAVGLQAVGLYQLPGGLRVSAVFRLSDQIGAVIRSVCQKLFQRTGSGKDQDLVTP